MTSISLCVVLFAHSAMPAPPDREPNAAELAKYLLSGVKNERERLQRGMFTAHGTKLVDSGKGAKTEKGRIDRLEGEVIITSAFDYSKGLLRFDRSEPEPIAGRDPVTGKDWHPQILGGKYARTPEKSMHWMFRNKQAEIHLTKRPPPPMIRPFDVRILGLAAFSDWRAEGRGFEEFHALYTKTFTATEVVAEKPGVYRVHFAVARPQEQTIVMWFDEKAGFGPTRMEFRARYGPVFRLISQSEVTWMQVSGVWVPKTLRIESLSAPPTIERYELEFQWKSVNQPLDEKLFTVEGFDLAHGTYLMDYRLHGEGKPLVIGAVGRKSVPEYAFHNARLMGLPEPTSMDELESIPERGFPWLLVWLAIGVMLAGISFYGYRRLRYRGA